MVKYWPQVFYHLPIVACTQAIYQQVFVLFIEIKQLHKSFYHAKFSKYAEFHKNPLQSFENMGP